MRKYAKDLYHNWAPDEMSDFIYRRRKEEGVKISKGAYFKKLFKETVECDPQKEFARLQDLLKEFCSNSEWVLDIGILSREVED